MSARVGVVGHVELVEFALVDAIPEPGEIVEAHGSFVEAAGGGGVAVVQMARLVGAASFFTAVGGDDAGDETAERLRGLGVDLHHAVRSEPQRRSFTFLDGDGERAITLLGTRLVPHGDDPLPWDDVAGLDAVYLTGGDVAAIRAARAARVLVATPRALPALADAHVELDVLVASATDEGEQVAEDDLDPAPRVVVLTHGKDGGEWRHRDGGGGSWDASEPPGEPVDAYGAGDSFAAGLTVALGADLPIEEAVRYAGRCGATCLTGRGPYGASVAAVGPPG